MPAVCVSFIDFFLNYLIWYYFFVYIGKVFFNVFIRLNILIQSLWFSSRIDITVKCVIEIDIYET